jgi:hypothetical protein
MLTFGLFIFILSGCVSAGSSPDPRFYMLKSIGEEGAVQKLNIPANTITLIGPVDIPQYLDRPQIVTQDDRGMINIAQFDRWGESLDAGIMRLIIEDLHLMLPETTFEAFPCNYAIPLNYQVIVEIQQLRSNLKGDLLLVAQWSIINANTQKMLFTKRSDLSQQINPHNYSGLADALSRAVSSLSGQIARNLSILANQIKKQPVSQEKK